MFSSDLFQWWFSDSLGIFSLNYLSLLPLSALLRSFHSETTEHTTSIRRTFLLTLPIFTGKKWHNRRKLLTGTFHFKVLETYIPTINEHSRSLVKNLISSSENDKPIEDIEQLITLCALDIVCGTCVALFLFSWC